MLVVSLEFKCSNEVLSIAAMLSGEYTLLLQRVTDFFFLFFFGKNGKKVPNVWLRRPPNQRRDADAAKALLTIPDSDHLTLLNVYNNYIQSIAPASSFYLFIIWLV